MDPSASEPNAAAASVVPADVEQPSDDDTNDTADADDTTEDENSDGTTEDDDTDDTDDDTDDEPSAMNMVPAPLRAALARRGFDQLTPVQLAALAADAAGRDLQISSQTGSGKTVALGLVMAPELLAEADQPVDPTAGPRVLIIAPTRELAAQVAEELTWLFAGLPAIGVDCVTGGTSVGADIGRLARGPRILVGTPGRLLDHIRSGILSCDQVSQLVLDEADQMLDMGFRDELEAILDATPESRRTHLVSATFPTGIRSLIRRYQNQPLHIEGTRLGEAHEDIAHVVHLIAPSDRYAALVNLLLLALGQRTLVFVKTRADASEVAAKLSRDGFSAMPLSGDLQQSQRTRTLAAFRAGAVSVLIATDVAARGLDVPDVATVIHAAAPIDAEAYTHRSGRTGRAGQKGRSVLLASAYAERHVRRLLSQAKVEARFEEAPDAKKVSKKLIKRMRREIYRDLEHSDRASAAQLDYAQRLLTGRDAAQVVATLLERCSPQLPTDPRRLAAPGRPGRPTDGAPPRRSGPHPRGPRRRPPAGGYTRFAVNWGHAEGANPKRLLALVCRRGAISGHQVGSIDVDARSSTFEVAADAAADFAVQARRPDSRDPKIRIRQARGDDRPRRHRGRPPKR